MRTAEAIVGSPHVANDKLRVACATALALLVMLAVDCALIAVVDWMNDQMTQATILQQPLSPAVEFFFASTAGLLVGVCTAQLLLVVCYAAFGDGSSPRRILYSTAAVTAFGVGLVLFAMWWFELWWIDASFGLLFPLLVFFTMQLPFWAVRVLYGWVVLSPWSGTDGAHGLQFTTAHLLGWSVFLALPLSILSATGELIPVQLAAAYAGWAVLLFVLTLCLVRSALDTRRSTRHATIAATLAIALATVFQSVAFLIIENPPLHEAWFALSLPAAGTFAGSALFVACLITARRIGFRLARH